ncbi:MAG: CBS domain-containing protein, partial [Mastigocoleus sp. MO_167.B18]|nr:CBS domain-containing protein [Mastigocoleus sp. MO_167.B18]
MQQNAEQIDLFALKQAIDTSPLTVPSDILVVDAIAVMMGWSRTSNSYEFANYLPEKINVSQKPEDYVLVVENLNVVGILTQTDVIRLTIAGKNLSKMRISEVMTREIIKIKQSPERDIFAVRSLMHEHRVCHLPIVDRQDSLVGIVTQSTLLQVLDNLEKIGVTETSQNQVGRKINQLKQIGETLVSGLETKHQFINSVYEEVDSQRIGQISTVSFDKIDESEEDIASETEFHFIYPSGKLKAHNKYCGRELESSNQKDINQYQRSESEVDGNQENSDNSVQNLNSTTSNVPICIYELDRKGTILFA